MLLPTIFTSLLSLGMACYFDFEIEEELADFQVVSGTGAWALIEVPDDAVHPPYVGEKVLVCSGKGTFQTVNMMVMNSIQVISINYYVYRPKTTDVVQFVVNLICEANIGDQTFPVYLSLDDAVFPQPQWQTFKISADLKTPGTCKISIVVAQTNEGRVYIDSIDLPNTLSSPEECYVVPRTTTTDVPTSTNSDPPTETTEDPIASTTDDAKTTTDNIKTTTDDDTKTTTDNVKTTTDDDSKTTTDNIKPTTDDDSKTTTDNIKTTTDDDTKTTTDNIKTTIDDDSKTTTDNVKTTTDDDTKTTTDNVMTTDDSMTTTIGSQTTDYPNPPISGFPEGFPPFSHFYMVVIIAVMGTFVLLNILVTFFWINNQSISKMVRTPQGWDKVKIPNPDY